MAHSPARQTVRPADGRVAGWRVRDVPATAEGQRRVDGGGPPGRGDGRRRPGAAQPEGNARRVLVGASRQLLPGLEAGHLCRRDQDGERASWPVFVANVDGSSVVAVPMGSSVPAKGTTWTVSSQASPDGQWIVFDMYASLTTSPGRQGNSLFRGPPRRFRTAAARPSMSTSLGGVWSPDGTRILYTVSGNNATNLRWISLDGTTSGDVTTSGGEVFHDYSWAAAPTPPSRSPPTVRRGRAASRMVAASRGSWPPCRGSPASPARCGRETRARRATPTRVAASVPMSRSPRVGRAPHRRSPCWTTNQDRPAGRHQLGQSPGGLEGVPRVLAEVVAGVDEDRGRVHAQRDCALGLGDRTADDVGVVKIYQGGRVAST